MTKVAAAACLAFSLMAPSAFAQVDQQVFARVQQEKAAVLSTLKDLVSIESGSGDTEGVLRIGDLIARRLQDLGGAVEQVAVPANMVRFENTPPQLGKMVVGRFRGTGTRKILLLAHMDTVYLKGMLAQQPFRVDGDRAYGLGIADDKHGVALILHALSVLKALNFRDFGLITVLITPDEEVSSAGSRTMITKLGSEHDIVFSCEGSDRDAVRLATAGIAAVQLKVTGRASHAGSAPEKGLNAIYELAHQIMQTRDLSDPKTGVKMNWTLANGGSARNVIPAEAHATADVRVLHIADYDGIEKRVRERVRSQLIPDTKVEVVFERTRPPLEPGDASRKVGEQAKRIYAEIGSKLTVVDEATGGGTDAAFAALQTKAPVLEGLGLITFGAHSNDAEYINVASIERRLYLLTRLIMESSKVEVPSSK